MAYWRDLFGTFQNLFGSRSAGHTPTHSLEGAGVATQGAVSLAAISDAQGSEMDPYGTYRDTTDYIDTTSPMNRQQRYKEYDRLDNTIPEIASALNVYADDASQQDEEGRTFKVYCKNRGVKEELEFLFFHLLEFDDNIWGRFRNLCKYGDHFIELIIDQAHPDRGVQKIRDLPVETMWRLETIRGRLLEFQQSTWGPDYRILSDNPHMGWNTPGVWQFQIQGMSEVEKSASIRFAPEQIVHSRVGAERKGFYPYGVSVVENAKGSAHSMKLMEDAMIVYRLTRAPERRIFYIDIGNTPPNRVEHFIERIKDKFKKRKIYNVTAGSVDERFNPLSQDEDYFLPIRPNTNSRIETLPGGQNLGEIDDTKYFRDKLLQSMTIPKSYFGQEDINMTRLSLSAQDIKFARVIDRIQKAFAHSLREIARRHLILRGIPEEDFEDLLILLTPSSDWRELARAEVVDARIQRASTIKTMQIMDDVTILTKILRYSEEEAGQIVSKRDKQIIREAVVQAEAQAAAVPASPPVDETPFDLGPPETPPTGPLPDMGMDFSAPAETSELPPTTLPTEEEPPTEEELELLYPPMDEVPTDIRDFEMMQLDREERDRSED